MFLSVLVSEIWPKVDFPLMDAIMAKNEVTIFRKNVKILAFFFFGFTGHEKLGG
jgi:hypothetical protein